MSIVNGKKTNYSKLLGLLQYIQTTGLRVFKRKNLEKCLPNELAMKYQTLSNYLFKLTKQGFLENLKPGIYMVANTETPIVEYEIAMQLVDPAVISHRSAFRHHDLTDQILHGVTLSTLKSSYVPQQSGGEKKSGYNIRGVDYTVICQHKSKLFGDEIAWYGGGKFRVTDLERTFLDGLSNPGDCGGFSEVIWAFQEEFERCDLDKIIGYAMQMDTVTSRRLGFVLDEILKIETDKISPLAKKDISDYRLLDATRESRGPYNAKWRIRENHHY